MFAMSSATIKFVVRLRFCFISRIAAVQIVGELSTNFGLIAVEVVGQFPPAFLLFFLHYLHTQITDKRPSVYLLFLSASVSINRHQVSCTTIALK